MRQRRQTVGRQSAIAALLVALTAGATPACSRGVLHGIDEQSANEAAATLERAGIGADKLSDDGAGPGAPAYTLRVARGDEARALEVLRAAGLPRDRARGFAETYAQPSLIPTPTEERARYADALGGELARTLESADGVVGARVHLVLPDVDPLAPDDKPRGPVRAAVLLKTRRGPAPIGVADVQRLVAGSVAGLDPAAVAVVVTTAADPAEIAPAPLAAVGPLRITPGTRPLLLAGLGGVLAILGVLAAMLFVTARRLAALERAARRPAGSGVKG